MVKTVLYVDDAVWKSFKSKVFQKHGTLRMMSKEATRVFSDHVMRGLPDLLSKVAPGTAKLWGPADVKKSRPKVRVSSAKLIREMREGS